MSGQPYRNASGGEIDRAQPLDFSFDGRRYRGYAGDTLASALLANGVRIVGRSFKYHRPRGIYSAGPEEPSALVQLGAGPTSEPNVRATLVELCDGLVARSQNCWPSARFDVGAAAGLLAPLLPAGFYYKTFMWPPGAWPLYEAVIRRGAGLGKAPRAPARERYESRFAHCDVLVAGGGGAGLAAALAAMRAGARVVLADEGVDFGGGLRGRRAVIGDGPALDWVRRTVAELEAAPEATLLRRTTVFGYYDHNLLGLAERVLPDGLEDSRRPRQRFWKLRARRVVLATGAIERPLVFPGNDRPGVMLAGAARTYARRFAVRPGERAVVFANNGAAHAAAAELAEAGVDVAAVVDLRRDEDIGGTLPGDGLERRFAAALTAVHGRRRVEGVDVMRLDPAGEACIGAPERVACDLVCVSGGWSPTVHLHAQSGARPVYDPERTAFVPGTPVQPEASAGAARGTYDLAACLAEGSREGAAAAAAAGFGDGTPPAMPSAEGDPPAPPGAVWQVPAGGSERGKRFVDLQGDVTADDVALAAREGYRSVEHLKRYTTLGMGTDQGKTSNVNGLTILAGVLGEDIAAVGTTTFRPPYTPVSLGAMAGQDSGARFDPVQRTPMHEWHARAGAVFMPAGLWLRAQYYPRRGENMHEAVAREARAVRESVGLVDVSTLGKIDLQGPDVAEFLNRIYVNGWKTLTVGKARYGVMLREDGLVLDDGTTTRIAEERYHMTTTTGGAGRVMQHLLFHLQTVWPELRVRATSVTDQWAAMALAGPSSRAVLERVVQGVDVSNAALPFMGYAEGRVAGVPARIFRISFSGELGYEVNVPAHWGLAAWQALMQAGEPHAIAPYGVEAMDTLRVEKGHLVVGADIDGRLAPADLGLQRMCSTKKDYVGRRMLERPAFDDEDRLQLVGLRGLDDRAAIPQGGHLVERRDWRPPGASRGRVTSPAFSPVLGCPIALALLERGRARHGEELYAVSPATGEQARVRVTAPIFVDPEGERVRS